MTPSEKKQREKPLYYYGRLTESWLAWLQMAACALLLPLWALVIRLETPGRFSAGPVNYGILLFVLVVLRIIGFFANPHIFADWFLQLFLWSAGLLGLASVVEILNRPWKTDQTSAFAPGLVREYLFDFWLPARLCTDEMLFRLTIPVTAVVLGYFCLGLSPVVGGYLVFSGILLGVYTNWMAVGEKHQLIRQMAMVPLMRPRQEILLGANNGDEEAAGAAGIAADPHADAAASPLPPAYHGVAGDLGAVLNTEALALLDQTSSPPATSSAVRLSCPRCHRRLKAIGIDCTGREVRCPACFSKFHIRKEHFRHE